MFGAVHVCCCFCSDEGANPAHVAADLLSQAEHGPDSQVVLLALPGVDLDAVQLAVQRQCDELPRNETARKALSHSCVVQVPSVGCLSVGAGCFPTAMFSSRLTSQQHDSAPGCSDLFRSLMEIVCGSVACDSGRSCCRCVAWCCSRCWQFTMVEAAAAAA